ncbi:MAG TPA: DUF4112 domain-containing protein [Chthoniobacterales bacterium]|nr:DUF4112 domain-containing protein [Chthoniobacterales bacterium]
MRTQTDVIDAEWEVLPPEARDKRARLEPLFRWVAIVMDELIALPNSKFKFGLDPLIGLIPGIGDTASAIVSALVLIQAARRGVPKILLARMSLNILINEIVGIIPGLGDAFSFWFKSNKRNYELLIAHTEKPRSAGISDWLFVIAALAILFLIVATGIFVSFLLLRAVAQLLGLG